MRGVVAAMCLTLAASALGGERPYAYVQGTETLPETGLEIESWFSTFRPPGQPIGWDWWFGPVVGITEHFEMALFAIFNQDPPVATNPPSFVLDSLRLQASYLLADRGTWPVDIRLRAELGQPVAGSAYSLWLYVIASRDFSPFNIPVNVTGNLMGWLLLPPGEVYEYLDYWAGAAVRVVSFLRLGAEFVGQTRFDPDTGPTTSLFLGPSVAVATGRIWVSASYDFGLLSSARQGRIVVGLAL